LGRTALEISKLSLGTSPFGGSFGYADESDCRACLHRALDVDITYFDTSPYYGRTRSEAVLGRCLRGISRDRYVLSTKVGRYGDRPEDFDFSADRVRRSVDESLERLGVDHVDIVLCHDIEHGSLTQVIDEAIPALREVVRQGKARFIGVSGLPLKVLTEVVSRAEIDVVLSYCHYTLGDTTLLDIIPEFERRGVGIINASPMGMGLFTDHGPPDWHPAPAEIREACRRAVEHCRSRGASLPRLALQFAAATERINSTLVGTSRADQIAENARWIDEPIDNELLAEVLEILRPIRNLTWPSGRPENA
jgi:L-galactose dehydrogenase